MASNVLLAVQEVDEVFCLPGEKLLFAGLLVRWWGLMPCDLLSKPDDPS